jgi:hypothetical protein
MEKSNLRNNTLYNSGEFFAKLLHLLALCLVAGFLTAGVSHAGDLPQLESDTPLSTAGYFQLTWQSEQLGSFELQQALNADFSDALTLYTGHDTATVLSGLADGIFFYRVRHENETNWSQTVKVEVQHHPLTRAFGFFTLGAVMFFATLVVLIKGTHNIQSSKHST